jgi:hypothetical protein
MGLGRVGGVEDPGRDERGERGEPARVGELPGHALVVAVAIGIGFRPHASAGDFAAAVVSVALSAILFRRRTAA